MPTSNFMGNEFGHPEWVDFPREGNGWSYHFARRQWSLADNNDLRYAGLNAFDTAMQNLDRDFHLLTDHLIEQLALHEDTHQIVYRRGPLVFAFNFHSDRVVRRPPHPHPRREVRLPRRPFHRRPRVRGSWGAAKTEPSARSSTSPDVRTRPEPPASICPAAARRCLCPYKLMKAASSLSISRRG